MNTVNFVQAHFRPILDENGNQTGTSDCRIDAKRLAADLASLVEEINRHGYEVATVTPVTSGSYSYKYDSLTAWDNVTGTFGYGYGFSFTSGLIVVSRKVL